MTFTGALLIARAVMNEWRRAWKSATRSDPNRGRRSRRPSRSAWMMQVSVFGQVAEDGPSQVALEASQGGSTSARSGRIGWTSSRRRFE